MTLVKICGIQDTESALAAASAGADYLGLVFAPSKRKVSLSTATEIVNALRELADRPQIAGVFVNQPLEEVDSIARSCGLDLIQLSGDESWDYCAGLTLPVIKALHISWKTGPAEIEGRIAAGRRVLGADLIFLLDTKISDRFGGTGQKFDWRLLEGTLGRPGLLVAGGLTDSNVASLISEYKPWGVDVSSGVETAGKKDSAKIRAFIRRAKYPNQENQKCW